MNFKRLIAVTAIAGMLAVTGCSANTPARNQGNRNGQRVADAVNRRPDGYRNERTTRSVNHAGNRAERRAETTGNRLTRTTNRSNTLGRPHNRAGRTFHRGHNRNAARPLTTGQALNTYNMNPTGRGVSANGANRNSVRVENRVNRGVALADTNQTAPVFFNKSKPAAPEQQAPQQTPSSNINQPAPQTVPAPAPAPTPAS